MSDERSDAASDPGRVRATIGPERTLRRAGGRWRFRVSAPAPGTPPWRIKVDEWQGRPPGHGERDGMYGVAHSLASHDREGLLPDSPDPVNREWLRYYTFPASELDEVVVGRWLHVEQMDTGYWWGSIAGVTVWVTADRDGRPTSMRVSGPDDHDPAVAGCSYAVDWPGKGLASEAVEALAELVRLKDGPRDDAYRAAKETAWQKAREVLDMHGYAQDMRPGPAAVDGAHTGTKSGDDGEH